MKLYKKTCKQMILLNSIILFLIFSFGGWKLYQSINETNKIKAFIDKNYPHLNHEHKLNSKVISIYHYPSQWRGGKTIQSLKLQNGQCYTIEIRKSLTSNDVYFGDILKNGVILKKNIGSDTLTMIVNDEKYNFLIFGK